MEQVIEGLPQFEQQRLAKLKYYEILDTPPDGSFDHITRMVSRVLNVPICLITLVDNDRIWFKSRHGLDVQEIGRDPGLCSSAILQDDVYEVRDAVTDPRTLENPLVAGGFGLRFYAAAPLHTYDGYNLGNLCVIDKTPRQLNDEEITFLSEMAGVVMDQMELRIRAIHAIQEQNKVSYMLAHDIKGPLSSLPVAMELIKDAAGESPEVSKIADLVAEQAQRSLEKVEVYLRKAALDATPARMDMEVLDLDILLKDVVRYHENLASQKNQSIKLTSAEPVLIKGDSARLHEAFANLMTNSIKFSSSEAKLSIEVQIQGDQVKIHFRDEGPGFSQEDITHAFRRFNTLSAKATGNESSTGLGLYITREIIAAHRGFIKILDVEKGADIEISLPLFVP